LKWWLLLSDCVQEFYHHQLRSGITELPRIFGMTASPIKSKGIKAYRKFLFIYLLC
jgi:hypothetical protein